MAFESVSDINQFWDFKENKTFIGTFVEKGELENDGEKSIIYIFKESESGILYNLNDHKAISDWVEEPQELIQQSTGEIINPKFCLALYPKTIVKFTFQGKKKIKGGRSFNAYDVQIDFSTVEKINADNEKEQKA